VKLYKQERTTRASCIVRVGLTEVRSSLIPLPILRHRIRSSRPTRHTRLLAIARHGPHGEMLLRARRRLLVQIPIHARVRGGAHLGELAVGHVGLGRHLGRRHGGVVLLLLLLVAVL